MVSKSKSFHDGQKNSSSSIPKKVEPVSTIELEDENVENYCDENLDMLKKVHSILLNCSNLNKQQKLVFCENERHFMKQYLRELIKRTE